MKCTQCGSNDLINTMNLPFQVLGDARLEIIKNEIFICLECGHIEFYNMYFVEKYKEKQKRYNEINKELLFVESQINKLNNIPFDSSKYEKEIKRLEDEIKTLISLGEDGKGVRARRDSIKDYKKMIDDKNDMEIKSQINHLRNRRNELIKELSQININNRI